ncbi:MAG: deoxyribose-phosphate aldolase [Halodesulfurarchaeum sp.]
MERRELAGRIDHTVLGPATTQTDVEALLNEAEEHGMNACIPPAYLPGARTYAGEEQTIVTVVGFPHGQHAPAVKRAEAVQAWEDGADEVDVVINVGRLKSGAVDAVTEELAQVVAAVPIPVKVIVETALLTEEETHAACRAAVDAAADFVKTSTGFASGGATVEDVRLMADYLPVKASGGIGTYEEAMAMLDAGAERIGASSGVQILAGAPD